jgi:SulP family sulfate permease
MPKSETLVMFTTLIVVVITHNLAIGVIVGVLVAMVAFARRVAHFVTVERTLPEGENVPTAYYAVVGELFFASSNDLTTQFEYTADPDRIVIDMERARVWDASTVAALDSVTNKYERLGKRAIIVGLDDASAAMRTRLSGNLGDDL